MRKRRNGNELVETIFIGAIIVSICILGLVAFGGNVADLFKSNEFSKIFSSGKHVNNEQAKLEAAKTGDTINDSIKTGQAAVQTAGSSALTGSLTGPEKGTSSNVGTTSTTTSTGSFSNKNKIYDADGE
jgi:hypothetical protein